MAKKAYGVPIRQQDAGGSPNRLMDETLRAVGNPSADEPRAGFRRRERRKGMIFHQKKEPTAGFLFFMIQ